MNTSPLRPALVVLAATSALALAGCASPAAGDSADATVSVVASTDVYGQIAEAIGGDAVTVTSVINGSGQDPHAFEPSARDQLTVDQADLLIENGGGYDPFIDALVEATGASAPVLTAATYTASWPGEDAHAEDERAEDQHAEDEHGDEHEGHGHIEGFNEHVWYDPAAMDGLATDVAAELTELAPEEAATFEANLTTFHAGIADLQAQLADLSSAHGGATVFVTEPVPLHLTDAAGLDNLTPEAFSEAVEEGQDVPPATLLEAVGLVADVDVVIVNAQTGGAETTRILDEAEQRDVPVLEFTETLPADSTYLEWMADNIAALESALS